MLPAMVSEDTRGASQAFNVCAYAGDIACALGGHNEDSVGEGSGEQL